MARDVDERLRGDMWATTGVDRRLTPLVFAARLRGSCPLPIEATAIIRRQARATPN